MSKSVELVQCGSCFQFVPPDADGMPDQNHICYKADPAMQSVRLAEHISQRDAETAARLSAETIAAQQAEIRRLESALHNCEHELAKAQAKLAELAGPPTWKHMDRIQRPETYR